MKKTFDEILTWDTGFSHSFNGFNPITGYMVGLKQSIFDRKPTDKEIKDFINEYPELLNDTTKYLGGWIDNEGQYYLDVSIQVLNRKEAKELGRLNKQIAIYDVESQCEIYL